MKFNILSISKINFSIYINNLLAKYNKSSIVNSKIFILYSSNVFSSCDVKTASGIITFISFEKLFSSLYISINNLCNSL